MDGLQQPAHGFIIEGLRTAALAAKAGNFLGWVGPDQSLLQRPLKIAGQGSQPEVNGRDRRLFDRLLVALPIGHISGNDRARVERLPIAPLGPGDKVDQGAAVIINSQPAFAFVLKVSEPGGDGGMEIGHTVPLVKGIRVSR